MIHSEYTFDMIKVVNQQCWVRLHRYGFVNTSRALLQAANHGDSTVGMFKPSHVFVCRVIQIESLGRKVRTNCVTLRSRVVWHGWAHWGWVFVFRSANGANLNRGGNGVWGGEGA